MTHIQKDKKRAMILICIARDSCEIYPTEALEALVTGRTIVFWTIMHSKQFIKPCDLFDLIL